MSSNQLTDDLYAVILAGGRGTRFWPVSRRSRPKQCVSLSGGPTMLQETVARLAPLIPPERVLVLTGPDMAALVREQLSAVPADNVIVEPSPRNTAPCIALAAVEVERRGGAQAVLAVLPADHHIGDAGDLREVLAAARQAALATHALVTLGIEPRHPEPGYGYLEVGPERGRWGGRAFRQVSRFTEKPDRSTAQRWLAAGSHLWNAGMFLFTAEAIREAIGEHLPQTASAMAELARDPGALERVWPQMTATSIDYGIMERSSHILTVPCDPDWSDLGAWPALSDILPAVEGGAGVAHKVVSVDSKDCVVFAPGKTVALVGLEDCVVVDTDDAILIMARDRAQSLRDLLSRLDDEAPELT